MTKKKKTKTASTSLLVLLLALCSCQACSDGGEGDGQVDAGPSTTNPDGLRKLAFKSLATEDAFPAIALSSDETQVISCSGLGKVAFFDARTLARGKVLDLTELATPKVESYCRISVIGDHAYAYYGNMRPEDPKRVFKVSVAKREVEAVWTVDEKLFDQDDFTSSGSEFSGVLPTAEPNVGLALIGLEVELPKDAPDPGIQPLYVDLETGAFRREKVCDVAGMETQRLCTAFAAGGRIVGTAWMHAFGVDPFDFIVDVESRSLVKLSSKAYWDFFDVDEETGQLLNGGLPSEGFKVYDLKSGAERLSFESPAPGFNVSARLLPGRHLAAIVEAINTEPLSFVTLVSTRTGEKVASAWLPDDGTSGTTVSRDGRRIYVAALEHLFLVEVPADL